MNEYYYDYTQMTREEKLSLLHDMFHNPNTSPEHMAIIHGEFKKVLHSGSPEAHDSTIYL